MILRSGLIGLSGGNTWMQRCIRYFIESDFSHSFVTFDVDNVLSVLETTSTLVCVTPFYRKASEANYVELWELKDFNDQKAFVEDIRYNYSIFAGMWYGYLSYIWFMYRWLCRKFKYEPDRMWGWCDRGVTCTELTVTSLINVFPKLLRNDLNTYTPAELRKVMVANPDKFECLGWYKEPKDAISKRK